jgi:hypothetical protein
MMLDVWSKLLNLARHSPMRVIVFEQSGGLESKSIKESPESEPRTGHIRQPGILEVDPAFRHDVLRGLSLRPRAIPTRWLYDCSGSERFEAITNLPEYYLTRTERRQARSLP